jgi:hypothetical protein
VTREQRLDRKRARRAISYILVGCRRPSWFERAFGGRPRLLALALGAAAALVVVVLSLLIAWFGPGPGELPGDPSVSIRALALPGVHGLT